MVLELALKLKQRGCFPVAYSPFHGRVAEEIRSAGIPVIHNLDQLQARPDVIHGHHHLETMAACLKFPDVPAISFCHGWQPWEEMPPAFSSIRHYVAVGETTRERILTEVPLGGRPVSILRTFFNDGLFRLKPKISHKPKRALIFNNAVSTTAPLCSVLFAACDARGMTLELCGLTAGNSNSQPERLLPDFDVVFATGRSALEAAACGCAVIVCDASGCAGLLRPEHLDGDRIALLELSARSAQSTTSELVCRELDLYDPDDLIRLATDVRDRRSLETAVTSVLALYHAVIADAAASPLTIGRGQLSEASDYITLLSARLKGR